MLNLKKCIERIMHKYFITNKFRDTDLIVNIYFSFI